MLVKKQTHNTFETICVFLCFLSADFLPLESRNTQYSKSREKELDRVNRERDGQFSLSWDEESSERNLREAWVGQTQTIILEKRMILWKTRHVCENRERERLCKREKFTEKKGTIRSHLESSFFPLAKGWSVSPFIAPQEQFLWSLSSSSSSHSHFVFTTSSENWRKDRDRSLRSGDNNIGGEWRKRLQSQT